MSRGFKQTIKKFFSFKKSSEDQVTGPDFVKLPEEQTPSATLELKKESFEKIEKSLFTDKDALRQAIELGVKISQSFQNRVISQFKRSVKSWKKAYESLKPQDFTDQSNNLQALVANINKGSGNYKKTIYTYRNGDSDVINKKGRTYLDKTYVLYDLSEKFKVLDEEQLNFLNRYPIPNEISKIKEIKAACDELRREPEQEIASEWDVDYSKYKITFEQFAKLIDVLSSLTPQELKIASEICYKSTYHYYITACHKAGEDASGWVGYKQHFKTPLGRIIISKEYSLAKGHEQVSSKEKYTLDTFKAKYMEAMHTASENSLQALKGGK